MPKQKSKISIARYRIAGYYDVHRIIVNNDTEHGETICGITGHILRFKPTNEKATCPICARAR